jgi:hypothetical protein
MPPKPFSPYAFADSPLLTVIKAIHNVCNSSYPQALASINIPPVTERNIVGKAFCRDFYFDEPGVRLWFGAASCPSRAARVRNSDRSIGFSIVITGGIAKGAGKWRHLTRA